MRVNIVREITYIFGYRKILLCLGVFFTFLRIEATENVSNHPRLLWSLSEEEQVVKLISHNQVMSNLNDYIITYADEKLEEPILKREMIGVRMLSVSREAIKRILYLAYAYRLSKDNRYADRAIEELVNVCEFEDWNPIHFLDVAEMVTGVAIGYDWLFDCLDQNQRLIIEEAIKKKALLPSLDEKKMTFLNRKDNWNQVCNSALVCAALAIIDKEGDFSREIIERSVISNINAMDMYTPHGVYPEGYNYWGFGTIYQVLMIDLIKYVYRKNYGLELTKGFKESAYFIQFMTTPIGKCFNFGDCPSLAKGQIALFWFAYQYEDISLIPQEIKRLENKNYYFAEDRFLPLILIWGARLKSFTSISPEKNFWISSGEVPLFIYRNGWESRRDSYLGVKGGSASTSHAHMDEGAFIYEYDGVRWADDLGMQDYNSLEKVGIRLWDMSQNGDRWDILRFRNDYHNTITINNQRHLLTGKAEIIESEVNAQYKGAVIDLSSVLGEKITAAVREVYLDEDDHLFVMDDISVGKDAIDLMWTMVTPANASIMDKNTICLEKSKKKMYVQFTVDGDGNTQDYIELKLWSNEPLHTYDAPNPHTMRIGFKARLHANENARFKVIFRPEISQNI